MRERDSIDLVACLLDPDGWLTAVDVGAGTGESSRRILRSFPRAAVHAFEPDAAAFEGLLTATARNAKVFPWQLAAGRASDSPSASTDTPGGSIATLAAPAVRTVTLDRWAAEHRIARVDFININHGLEPLEVLRGASGLIRKHGVRAIRLDAAATTTAIAGFFAEHDMCPFPPGTQPIGDSTPAAAGLWMRSEMLERLKIEPARAYRIDWRLALGAALDACMKSGARRIALYGAGHHTLSCESVVRSCAALVAIIDDNRGRADQVVLGLPVLTLAEARDIELDAVVISSNTQEQTIWERAACFRDAQIPVIRLYPEPVTGVPARVIAAQPASSAGHGPLNTHPPVRPATGARASSVRPADKGLRDSLFRPVVFSEYEKLFLQRLAALGYTPGCVFDIGAASGWWSSIMSDVFPDANYELFEPLLGNNPLYDGDLATILPTHPRFRAHATALGEAKTQAQFWRDPGEGYGSSLLCEKMKESQRITVPVARLDDYVAQHSLSQPQIIKVDVQGGEASVIEGGKQAFAGADILHLETWLERCYGPRTPLLHELIEILTPLNFRLVQFGGFWRHDRQTLSSVDAFFANIGFIERLTAHGAGYPWPANGEY